MSKVKLPAVSITVEADTYQAHEVKMIAAFWKELGITVNLHSTEDALNLVRKGVKKPVLTKIMQQLGLSLNDMASILHTSERTLRRYDAATVLNAEQSERLVELAKLFAHARVVFGTPENTRQWLHTSLWALNHKKPVHYFDTSLGIEHIHTILHRIEHGIVA
ncbi:MAG: hypothetical protein RL660_1770 [Bacteroidota bacterium]|jgi:putative toxin-antitoxin system antitoxin component (TIGR02293 family)